VPDLLLATASRPTVGQAHHTGLTAGVKAVPDGYRPPARVPPLQATRPGCAGGEGAVPDHPVDVQLKGLHRRLFRPAPPVVAVSPSRPTHDPPPASIIPKSSGTLGHAANRALPLTSIKIEFATTRPECPLPSIWGAHLPHFFLSLRV